MSENENTEQNQEQEQPSRGVGKLVTHVSGHKLEIVLWMTRLVTVISTFCYIFPFFGSSPYSWYQRALISNAATSALRLHQRLPAVRLTREFFAQLLLEDSCHYLFFSIIFMNAFPMTLVLLPLFLFAVLHSASYSLTLLDQLGQNSWWGARLLVSIVEYHQRNILRLVSFTEIFLMPFCVIMIIAGKLSLLIPFVYYRFLTLRYASRRNPYTRQVFAELRLVVESYCNSPSCPAALRNIAQKMIGFVTRLAPPTTVQ